MKLGDKYWHKRHGDWEAFDRIELEVVPRYKTSGMSGDEWRTSVLVRFYFKGEVVHERSYSAMKYALMMLGHEWVTKQEPIPSEVIEIEKTRCDQAGCSAEAVAKYVLKKEYSARGELLDSTGLPSWKHYRQFCQKHCERGDCGMEDQDDNYEVLEGPGPEETTNTEESPSIYGGTVEIG